MTYLAVATPVTEQSKPRNSIAGAAWMPAGSSTPQCSCCQSAMQLFLQFDIARCFETSFEVDSHLVLFMCPQCNEIPSFADFSGRVLPQSYWNNTEANFHAALFRPGRANAAVHGEALLKSFSLAFVADSQEQPSTPRITVGGSPQWVQNEEEFTCACGGEMRFLSQISENFAFRKLHSAPPQPDSFSADDYCLFLGNEVYIFACENRCDERAVWITVQN